MIARRRTRRASPLLPLASLLVGYASPFFGGVGPARADDLSAADKLRVIWSNQFAWTPEGIPIMTVGLATGRDAVVIAAGPSAPVAPGAQPAPSGGVRVLPDGEGGPELRAGNRWTLRVAGGRPAEIRYEVVVASGRVADSAALQEQLPVWRKRGYVPSLVELGTVFGLRGEVIDMRSLVLTVTPTPTATAATAATAARSATTKNPAGAASAATDVLARARAEADRIARAFHVETSLHPVVATRPHGMIEARDEKGTLVRNEDVLWFASGDDRGTLTVPDIPQPGQERRYAGKLYVTLGSDGKLAVANAVPEDRLLAGLLPAEMGASAPPEALKAQAVAARNELFAKIGTRHLTDPYRLCSSVHCQVYAGAGQEDPRATAAVSATRGELLVRDSDGTLVDAVYSSACGGHTEDNDRAWGTAADPALRGHLDAGEADARTLARFADLSGVPPLADEEKLKAFLGPLPVAPSCAAVRASSSFRWTARVAAAAVEERAGVGRLRDVKVLERGVSGRVTRLELGGERGAREVKGELEVRRLFGGLKSSLFVVSVERDAGGRASAFSFVGGGYGHGVGMCQAGAMGMAEHGSRYRDILNRYYQAGRIRRFY